MKVLRNIALIFSFLISKTLIFMGAYIGGNLSAVDEKSEDKIIVEIAPNTSTKQIGKLLEEKGLIHSKDFFYFYCRTKEINDLKASTYELSKSMDLEEIIDILREGNNYNPDRVSITFREGINVKKVASVIENSTNNTKDDVFNKLKDSTYIDKLISEYWFLTEEIKNSNIYYPLEGYLYPDTYFLENKDVTVEQIFKIMLDEMNKRLTPYKEKIEKSNYSVHNYLTLASIAELEAVTDSDRKNVCGVFYNRINKKMSLGSDVTTYYAFGIEMNERDLKSREINT